jgi:hypothetical protein
MKRGLLILLFCLFISICAPAQKATEPSFSRYAATVEKGHARSIDFNNDAGARTMRTRLSEALSGGINFAGHYIVASWGCGTGCISGAIIEAKTGKVYWPLPLNALSVWYDGQNYADEPIAFHKNSRLLIISGSPGGKDNDPDKPNGKYYYEWKANGLHLVKYIPFTSK